MTTKLAATVAVDLDATTVTLRQTERLTPNNVRALLAVVGRAGRVLPGFAVHSDLDQLQTDFPEALQRLTEYPEGGTVISGHLAGPFLIRETGPPPWRSAGPPRSSPETPLPTALSMSGLKVCWGPQLKVSLMRALGYRRQNMQGHPMDQFLLTCTNAILDVDVEGTFHLRWIPGSTVSAADADAVVAAVQGATRTKPQPMLAEIVDLCMSPGAREILAGTRFVSAVALVGAAAVDRVMAAALLREQDCPHGYFTSVNDAREWLNQLPVPDALEGYSV